MGIHDIDTMNRIREELTKIDPTIFIYGEGWLAADSPLPPEKRAVRDHVGEMEGIAVFCDDFRDAVRGSTFDEQAAGYASGNIVGHYEPVKFGIAAPRSIRKWIIMDCYTALCHTHPPLRRQSISSPATTVTR